MLAPLKITFTDGREVVVTPRTFDAIRFERAYEMPVIKALGTGDIHMEHLWWFAHAAYKRDNPDTPEFDEWGETVDAVEFVDEEPAAPLDRTP